MQLNYLLFLATFSSTRAFVEPESTFGTSLIEAANATRYASGTVFYFADEIPPGSLTHNLFGSLDLKDASFDARSGKLANLDLSEAILPGDANNLLWSVGSLDSLAGKPDTDAEWKNVGTNALRGWIASHQSELDIDARELFVTADENDIMAVRSAVHGDGDMIQFSLQRTFQGIVVRDSRASATIKAGNLVNIGFETWSDIPTDFDVSPRVSENDAYQALSRATGYELNDGETCKPQLQILTEAIGNVPLSFNTKGLRAKFSTDAPEFGMGYTHLLVWKVCPAFKGQTVEKFEALIDAKTAVVISVRDTVEYFEAKGDVYPLSNDGIGVDGVLQLDWPMPFASVGMETTDTGGNYFNLGFWTGFLRGPYVDMVDICGREFLSGSDGIDWGGKDAEGDCDTPGFGGRGNTHASRSGFYELNKIKEIARSHLPSNTWLQTQLRVIMNVRSSCNAYYDGNAVFYRRGDGCGNTGELASVVDHEWGHGMDDWGVAAGISEPSGEGIADVYAALRLNDSCIGRGFYENDVCSGNGNPCISCSGVRDIDYLKRKNQTPSTLTWAKKNCGSGVHCLGYVYAEAIWSLYKRHLQNAPYNYDDNTALEITMRLVFIGAGNVKTWFEGSPGSAGCGSSSGYRQFLLADDDNGNLNDGTPHMDAIFNAFNDQEIACPSPEVRDFGCLDKPNTAPQVKATPGDMKTTLSWNTVSGASKYEVFRTEGVHGCEQGKVKLTSTTELSFTDTGLMNGREYYYVVIPKGSNDACFGQASQCITVTSSESTTPSPSAEPTQTPQTPTTSTPCGNGVCELQNNEDLQSCPIDCVTQDLQLPSGNSASKGAMFTVTAENEMIVSSIGVLGKRTRNSLVHIYTRSGPIDGFEDSSSGWELCYTQIVLLDRSNPTFLEMSCNTHTPAGSSRSFHVYVKAGMLIETGASNPSNNALRVENAVFLRDLFSQVRGAGLMAGTLRFYEVSSQSPPTPHVTTSPTQLNAPSARPTQVATPQSSTRPTRQAKNRVKERKKREKRSTGN